MTGDRRMLPAAVADMRGQALLSVVARATASIDWRPGLAVSWDDVPTAYLPYAIRGAACQDYVDPDMPEAMQRSLLANAPLIKVQEGTIKGVTFALSLIGVGVARWERWMDRAPMGAPGTHTITVAVADAVYEAEGRSYTQRLQRHVAKVVATAKRHSQGIAIRFQAASEPPAFVGVLTRTRLRVVPNGDPVTQLVGSASLFAGALIRTRLRVFPEV